MQQQKAGTSTVKTACSYCGVGCGMVLDVGIGPDDQARRVLKASGDKEHPANFGRLCTKGATSADMLAAGGRLATALVRDRARGGTRPRSTSTPRSARPRAGCGAIIDEHGPDALAFYVSGQMRLEAQYLANKLAKGFVRTNQIESNSRLCMASAGTGYKLSLGADGPPGSYEDFDHADVFFVIGANMADCHPILFLRMMERVKAGREADRGRSAAHRHGRQGRPVPADQARAPTWRCSTACCTCWSTNGHIDPEFIAEHTEGWEAMPEFLADYPPETVAEITGIPEADIRQAAAVDRRGRRTG